ncbi:unnamed protein product, partial [marine sediment metagenome]
MGQPADKDPVSGKVNGAKLYMRFQEKAVFVHRNFVQHGKLTHLWRRHHRYTQGKDVSINSYFIAKHFILNLNSEQKLTIFSYLPDETIFANGDFE